MGIGVETSFQYEKEISDVIKKSKNIIAWVVNKNCLNDIDLSNYRKKEDSKGDFVVFER